MVAMVTRDIKEPTPLRVQPESASAVLNATLIVLGIAADSARQSGDAHTAHLCSDAATRILGLRVAMYQEWQRQRWAA
jgi:hypothetical protein